MAGIPPQQALYIHNLNDKLQKDELKRALYHLFSQYGPIMDIIATKVQRMRGQAFVTFKDVTAATTAMRQLQGMVFFEKHMKIQYAKTKSDVVARLDGTYSAKKKRERKEKEREREKEKERLKRKAGGVAAITEKDSKRRKLEEEERQREREREREREKEKEKRKEEEEEVPHKVLFIENLPPEAMGNPEMLAVLFQNFDGFVEARIPPGNKPVAFVDFNTPVEAKEAKMALQGFKITYEHSLQISYAKK
uniref:RRM domain-containing protein n=1 Tax=Eutreptiella gymnastica TaxID=73025 RepID=A0A7S1J5K2_9EUGL|mmetsp:Transcript_68230/g.120710  ORF Transcript_68230/g.120710 Transcript_68230/m.120710 type:complete len:250 (+) Transcript_68230:54-803(+)